ncbi:MAG TPA: peroxiredoxin, partial [Deinococcales bacterium]|nr:peroxiredoxin [Deinococcales bacterium]
TLSDFRGEWVVLYFYPKDNTPGCTTQACDLRDNLGSLDARVLGVSPDPLSSHEKFRDDHGLTFPLLSDEDHSTAEAYGAWGEKTSFGTTVTGLIRSTFIIDPEGKLAEVLYNVRAKGHADRIGKKLQELRNGAGAA